MDVAALPDPTDVSHSERQLEEKDVPHTFVFEYVRSLFRATVHCDWPRYKLQVPDGTCTREYLVGKPLFRAIDMTGRGTRGYVALDCQTGCFVWLKDAWRASYVISETEGDTLQRLNKAGVENVPTLVCHGDIFNQATATGDVWERQHSVPSPSRRPSSPSPSTTLSASASSGSRKRKRDDGEPGSGSSFQRPRPTVRSNCPLQQHKHYRIVVQEVCLPLRDFQCGPHRQAATKPTPQLLHRDISGGNILIYPRVRRDNKGKNPQMVWSGLLSDWELAKPIDTVEAASKATQEERMGTYQYMSVNLLYHITKPVQISDELESFFHVLVYYAVRYLRSNCSCTQSWIDNYFYKYLGPGRAGACGQKSYALEVTGELRVTMGGHPLAFRSPMNTVLATILNSLRARYRVMYYDDGKAAELEVSSPPAPHEPPPAAPEPEPPVISSPSPNLAAAAGIDPAVLAQWEADWEAETLTVPGPTEEERKLAARLDDHVFMLAFLARQLANPYWNSNDRIPSPKAEDRKTGDVDAGARARPGPEDALGPSSSKRRRTGERKLNASLPARLHASTRRAGPKVGPI
ncbi:hypothetical protein GSI_05187 [Ganoderma sinense ZZ0214-1]|uniref:Fungal-type protein kinase domain-containing protein n=1 Tax=Ganoderma sinense ZZ0214-1 TaxID=1077348 RepID=A0A2G8SFC6_9APHY|nr:hypothetical protein GSI_05187 [Ganoderma sinense ZZ0214-1]